MGEGVWGALWGRGVPMAPIGDGGERCGGSAVSYSAQSNAVAFPTALGGAPWGPGGSYRTKRGCMGFRGALWRPEESYEVLESSYRICEGSYRTTRSPMGSQGVSIGS